MGLVFSNFQDQSLIQIQYHIMYLFLTLLSLQSLLCTEDSVMITTLEKDTLYGIGFESDSDLENWKILNPSGVTERN